MPKVICIIAATGIAIFALPNVVFAQMDDGSMSKDSMGKMSSHSSMKKSKMMHHHHGMHHGTSMHKSMSNSGGM